MITSLQIIKKNEKWLPRNRKHTHPNANCWPQNFHVMFSWIKFDMENYFYRHFGISALDWLEFMFEHGVESSCESHRLSARYIIFVHKTILIHIYLFRGFLISQANKTKFSLNLNQGHLPPKYMKQIRYQIFQKKNAPILNNFERNSLLST